MLRFAVVSLLVALSVGMPTSFENELDAYWETFKSHHNKNYGQEEGLRRMIWEKNIKGIQRHNMEADLGHHDYRLGVNEYSDWTNDEFRSFMNGYKMGNTTGSAFLAAENIDVPDKVDWRDQGYVTPVKNQEQCGSCWSFSATGSLEGQHFKKSNTLVSLSEQNLMDCSKKQGNHGCEGGLMDFAFEYIKSNGGIDTEKSYPYTAKDGICHFKKGDVGATCTGYVDIPSGNEKALMKAVATIGPISVAIDAGHPEFQAYKSGVFDFPGCSSTQLDHGVLAVGYGTFEGKDYWLVKNSWGESWGMMGYIMMSRNKDNQCGIATQASYPLV